ADGPLSGASLEDLSGRSRACGSPRPLAAGVARADDVVEPVRRWGRRLRIIPSRAGEVAGAAGGSAHAALGATHQKPGEDTDPPPDPLPASFSRTRISPGTRYSVIPLKLIA